MSASTSSTPSLILIIRFSASIPDLPLPLLSPQTTTSTTLSSLIRPHLPSDLATCPLRYIYAGALLQPGTPLSSALRLSQSPIKAQQYYIHCSISTATHLTPAELEAEARTVFSHNDSSTANQAQLAPPHSHEQSSQPQGFDGLLSAGFTPTEVASLRSQFLAIQAHAHTPDTMPSGNELRVLEERWLDTNNRGAGGNVGDDGDGSLAGGSGGLEDILWGNIAGFFWAIGAIVWLVREEGVWSKRRQVGVLTGVLVNIAFCVLRAGS